MQNDIHLPCLPLLFVAFIPLRVLPRSLFLIGYIVDDPPGDPDNLRLVYRSDVLRVVEIRDVLSVESLYEIIRDIIGELFVKKGFRARQDRDRPD